MDRWAREEKYDCNFLCVCVTADRGASRLAADFASQLKLQHCVNAFIDNQADMPDYGQLGCSGFIVMDAGHTVVSTCTSPFLQVRSLAFAHVEALLEAIVARRPMPPVCPGEFVRISGGEADLEGASAVCLRIQERGALLLQVLTGPKSQQQVTLAAWQVAKIGSERELERGEPDSVRLPESCSNGACREDDCQEGPSVDEAYIAAQLALVSVRVPAMDAEHAECADALRRLATEMSAAALREALETLGSHFAHEEALFDEHGFGEHADARFSAKRTHIDDHNRLLEKMRRELLSESPLTVAFARDLLQDFHEHTSRYDTQYSDLLSQKCIK